MPQESLAALCDSLPALEALTAKVAQVHGPSRPSLFQVRDTYRAAAQELSAAAQDGAPERAATVTAQLAELERLTENFAHPANACRSYRAMLDGLQRLHREATLRLRALAQEP